MEEFEKASCIQGFHVNQDNWTPILGKQLVCKNEPGNPRDQFVKQEMRYRSQLGIFLEICQPCVRFLFGAVELFTAQFQGDGKHLIIRNIHRKTHDWRVSAKIMEVFHREQFALYGNTQHIYTAALFNSYALTSTARLQGSHCIIKFLSG